jgi:hypothetical protein
LAGLTTLEGFCSIQSLDLRSFSILRSSLAHLAKNENSKNIKVIKSCNANIKSLAPKLLYEKTEAKTNLRREVGMKKLMLGLVMLGLGQAGCEFIGGALVGAGATGAGYEYNAYRQMEQLEEDYKNEKISRAEYEKRKQQIEAGSIMY